jgi:hypothetical protein
VANWIHGHISRGAADALFQLALMARTDPEEIKRFLFDSVPLWEALDRETLHPPTETPEHA